MSKAHERLTRIFLEAAEKPPGERAAYLDEACGADEVLRSRVEAMLAKETGSLIDLAQQRKA